MRGGQDQVVQGQEPGEPLMTIEESYEQTSERLREYDRCGQDRVEIM